MSEERLYIIDTNTLITPQNHFYPFDLFPVFWESLENLVKDGTAIIIENVAAEIKQEKDDELASWVTKHPEQIYKTESDKEIINVVSAIFKELQNNENYDSAKSIDNWSKVADPWVIATAKVKNGTIVTFEKMASISSGNPSGKPKIPNIASIFGVRTINLFQMIREVNLPLY